MLVLTRRTEESVVIGGNIVITVLGVEGEKVKLGIDAPREVTILRSELLDAIAQQNRLAEKRLPSRNRPHRTSCGITCRTGRRTAEPAAPD